MTETVALSIETARGDSESRPSGTRGPVRPLGATRSRKWHISWGPVLLLAALVVVLITAPQSVPSPIGHTRTTLPVISSLSSPHMCSGTIARQFDGLIVAWAGLWLVGPGTLWSCWSASSARPFQRTSFILLATGLILDAAWERDASTSQVRPLCSLPGDSAAYHRVLNQIIFPLQLFASRIAAEVLPVFGVPVCRKAM